MTDVYRANSAITEGRLESIIKQVSDLIKPECSFYYSEQGYRAGLFVFDLKDTSMIPQIAEPFFIHLNAKVEFIPAMDSKELSKGLESWQKQSASQQTLS